MLSIFLHPSAQKELKRIPSKFQKNIRKELLAFASLDHPLQHRKVIKLQGKRSNDFRMRVGDYRIRITFESSAIFVTHIRHRQVGYSL